MPALLMEHILSAVTSAPSGETGDEAVSFLIAEFLVCRQPAWRPHRGHPRQPHFCLPPARCRSAALLHVTADESSAAAARTAPHPPPGTRCLAPRQMEALPCRTHRRPAEPLCSATTICLVNVIRRPHSPPCAPRIAHDELVPPAKVRFPKEIPPFAQPRVVELIFDCETKLPNNFKPSVVVVESPAHGRVGGWR